MKHISRNLFERDGWYYFRWKSRGESRRVSLLTQDIKEARAQAKELRHRPVVSRFEEEEADFRFDTVVKVLAYYQNAGCPTRAGKHRSMQRQTYAPPQRLAANLGADKPDIS